MKNVIRNHSAQQNALSTLQNAQTAEGNALQAKTQADYTRDSIALQKEGYKMSQKWNNVNFGISMGKVGIDLGTSIASMIVTADQSSASSELNEMTEEGERLVDESVASGDTYYGENSETGEIELVMSSKVTDWYNNSRQKIEDSNHLTSTKKSLLQSLDYTYENLQTSANKSTVQKYYSNLNANFQTSLSSAKRTDTESYVAAGGNRDLWNQSATIEGISVIYGRNDWSAETKAAQTTDYLLSVVSDGDTMIASDYARTQGLQAAYDYIQGLTGYTETEKQKMYSTASNAQVQATAAATETAEGLMEDALVNSSSTPEQVYTAIETQYKDAAPSIVSAAVEAAKEKQKSYMTKVCSNQLAADTASGINAMMTTYSEISGGAWDAKFYGIEDTKASVMNSYASAIKTKQSELATQAGNANTTITRIDTANGKIYDAYEKESAANLEAYEAGSYDGATYIQTELEAARKFNAQYSEGGSTDTSTWRTQTTNAAVNAVKKVMDNYVPTRYKDEVEDVLDNYLKVCLGLNVTTNSMTQEQAEELYEANAVLTGQFADYIRDNGADMTDEQFAAWAKKKADDYVWLQSHNYDKILDGDYIPKSNATMASRIDSFNSVVSASYGSEKDGTTSPGSYFVKWDTCFVYDYKTGTYTYLSERDAGYKFANDNVEATWTSMATLAKSEVQWLTGDNDGMMTVYCDTDEDGHPILSPIVVSGTSAFRFKDGTIQYGEAVIDTNGNATVQWTETGLKIVSTASEMMRQVQKSSLPLVKQISHVDDSTAQPSVPTVDTWAKDNPEPSLGDIYDYLAGVDDIDAAATKLKELNANGTITVYTMGSTTADEHIDGIVNTIKGSKGQTDTPTAEETPNATPTPQSGTPTAETSGTVQSFNSYVESGAKKAGNAEEESNNQSDTKPTGTTDGTGVSAAVSFVKEHPKASIGDVRNFLEGIEDEGEFERAVTDLLNATKTDNFLSEKTNGNGETYILYYAGEIRKKKGWN